MTRYAFYTFPEYGHVNPTLAIVEALITLGEEVVYYLSEPFRPVVEATGATFRAFPFRPFDRDHVAEGSAEDANRRLAMLPVSMMEQSGRMVPLVQESLRAEGAGCVVCDGMFLWARMAARQLEIPCVALSPTYAMNAHFSVYGASASHSPSWAALVGRHTRLEPAPLTIVFLPRAFQPAGETFDERFLFVGPSLQARRHDQGTLPLAQLGTQPLLYISLGTTFNNQVAFYQLCFDAFGDTPWQVVLSHGTRIEPAALGPIPGNFLVAPQVPQLEILPRTEVFVSHGGMGSVMESLACGVPLVVVPHILEQEVTARRVQELGLGLALDSTTLTADQLREAVAQVAGDGAFRTRAQAMQQAIQEAGGYRRAVEAVIAVARRQT
jgi:UDP:flavonoid glycosyltransferase YjiC (YdhE family)